MMRHTSDSPFLSGSIFVSGSVEATIRSTSAVAGTSRSSISATATSVSDESGIISPSRLAAVRQCLDERFPVHAASRMTTPHRQSTIKVYDGRWKLWCDGCATRSCDSLQPSVADVSTFFMRHLFEVKLPKPATIGIRIYSGFCNRGIVSEYVFRSSPRAFRTV